MDNDFDLKLCMDCSTQTFKEKFGLVPRFEELEQLFSGIQQNERPIAYRQLAKLKSRKYWNFQDYWLLPSWMSIRKELKKTAGIFHKLPGGEKESILVLYSIFKNIEVVSIILRFVDPTNYGIISPPVRSALNKRARENYVDEYLDYLQTLRAYSSEFEFKRVADADVALWSLVEKCIGAGGSNCSTFKKYQARMVEIEEQFIKATSIYHALEDEILEVAEQGIEAKELEITRLRDNLAKLRSQMDDMPQNLIIIEKSALRPSQKLIHDGKEMEIDSAQKYFMTRLAEYPYINKIIWSENITAKHPTRISNIKEDGEITILYVTKDNYAAKIKIYPSKCPDRTHARYFAQRVSKSLGIVILEDKYGRAK